MIMFKFVDRQCKILRKAAFEEQTKMGIIYADYEKTISEPRWGIVLAVGPKVDKEIQVGSEIWIEPLGWTTAFKPYGEEPFWFTSIEKVIGIAE